MSADHQPIVIVRRRSTLEDEPHGGAWKIAFADFMTAMMAFFLVLWIISATDKNTKTIIARYFNPVKVEEPARAQKGIRGAPDQNIQYQGKEPGAETTDKSRPDQAEPPAEVNPAPTKDRPAEPEPVDPAKPKPTMSEDELFSDPHASLDKIEGASSPGPLADPASAPSADLRSKADGSYRDPFRPLASGGAIRAAGPNQDDAPSDGSREETAVSKSSPNATSKDMAKEKEEVLRRRSAEGEAPTTTVGPAEKAPAGTAEKASPGVASTPANKPDAAQAASSAAVSERAAALLADLKRRLGPEAPSTPSPQLDVQPTDEGVLISLTDRQNFSMFAIGSAEPQRRVVRMMDAIAATLEATPGSIVVRGHTDAHPYHTNRYDNWRLSSARAQMAYYMLTHAGVPEARFERIEGFADHRLKDKAKPFAAENRRIEILLREAKP